MSKTGTSKSFLSEYAAVRDGGAGLIDLSSRGRILVSGSEAVMFLNGLITNDMKTLALNSWMPAAFPSVQGRLLAAARVIHRSDGFLIDTESATHQRVADLLGRFTLAGDFRVADITGETALLSVQGKAAAGIIRTVLGDEAAELERQKVSGLKTKDGSEVTIICATHTAEEGFDIFVAASEAAELRQTLINAGAKAVGDAVFETLRVEAGIPRYGVDMDQTTVVSETNLDDAISFTKGCYVGQEIIVRIKHRGHVAKKLSGVMLEGRWTVAENADIISDDHEEIGRITSLAFSPRLDRSIALAYVKYDYLEEYTRVWVDWGEKEIVAEVASLPMVRGSWYASDSNQSQGPDTSQ